MSTTRPRSLGALLAVTACLFAAPADARLEGVPYLDNETIGLARAVGQAVDMPADVFDNEQWGMALLESLELGGDMMGPLRYLIAFSAYSVAQTASHTPAWREPYRELLAGFIEKMLQRPAWEDWILVWDGVSPLGPDNIMYSGHLVYMMTLYRHLFGDTRYEVEGVDIVDPALGITAHTDAHLLAQDLADQAATYSDAAGASTLSIACEPGRIFVPCNTPHRVHQVLYDRLYGTSLSATNAAWLDWVRAEMYDPTHGVLYDLYWPFGRYEQTPSPESVPEREDRLSGLYNGWSIWLIHVLDPEWAAELYVAYKAYFVARGADSPLAGGATVMADGRGSGFVKLGLDLVSTGFAMIVTRLFDDTELYSELEASWNGFFGEPVWTQGHTVWSHHNAVLPLLVPNAYHLLARTTSPEHNARTIALGPVGDERFDAPYLAAVGHDAVFVNQAFWDTTPGAERLVLTVNGGGAVHQPTTLSVANLDPQLHWAVTRNGEPWGAALVDGDQLTITTPALTTTEETYLVQTYEPTPPPAAEPTPEPTPEPPEEEPAPVAAEPVVDSPAPSASGGCSGSPAPAAPPALLLLLLLAVTGRRFLPRRER